MLNVLNDLRLPVNLIEELGFDQFQLMMLWHLLLVNSIQKKVIGMMSSQKLRVDLWEPKGLLMCQQVFHLRTRITSLQPSVRRHKHETTLEWTVYCIKRTVRSWWCNDQELITTNSETLIRADYLNLAPNMLSKSSKESGKQFLIIEQWLVQPYCNLQNQCQICNKPILRKTTCLSKNMIHFTNQNQLNLRSKKVKNRRKKRKVKKLKHGKPN